MRRTIGIVGGIGNYAGIDLIKKIYDHTKVTSDQEHLSVSMISEPHKITDRSLFLSGKIKENPGIAINKIIKNLNKIEAHIIGIPCNTAHVSEIFKEIKKDLPKESQVLHLIEEVGHYVQKNYPSIKKVGVLCTNGTYTSQVYSDTLSSFNLDTLYPSEEIQYSKVHPAIYNPNYGLKAFTNPVKQKTIDDLIFAAHYLCKIGAEIIILGCTEIPLAITQQKIDNRIILNSTSILAQALIREATK